MIQLSSSPDILKRSVVWHLLRKEAKVTGSSLHSAIGQRGLKEQKRYYENISENIEQTFPQSVENRLKHGIDNGIHAVACINW